MFEFNTKIYFSLLIIKTVETTLDTQFKNEAIITNALNVPEFE